MVLELPVSQTKMIWYRTAQRRPPTVCYNGVDAQLTAQDLDFQADSGGALSVDSDSQSLLIAGTDKQITTVGAGQFTVSLPANVEVATTVAVPTVKTSAIQHSAGNNAAMIDSLGDISNLETLTVTGDLFVNGSSIMGKYQLNSVEDRTIELQSWWQCLTEQLLGILASCSTIMMVLPRNLQSHGLWSRRTCVCW